MKNPSAAPDNSQIWACRGISDKTSAQSATDRAIFYADEEKGYVDYLIFQVTSEKMGEQAMIRHCHELTLMDALTDPLVQLLMAADQVDAHEFETALNQVAGTLRREAGCGGAAIARVCRVI